MRFLRKIMLLLRTKIYFLNLKDTSYILYFLTQILEYHPCIDFKISHLLPWIKRCLDLLAFACFNVQNIPESNKRIIRFIIQ